MQSYERVLSAIDGLGLEIDDMLVMIETLDAFIRGRTLEDLSEQEAVRRSGLSQDDWMQTQVPYIESLMASGRYPLVTRVVLDARTPHDPDRLEHGFEVGPRASARRAGHDAPRITRLPFVSVLERLRRQRPCLWDRLGGGANEGGTEQCGSTTWS